MNHFFLTLNYYLLTERPAATAALNCHGIILLIRNYELLIRNYELVFCDYELVCVCIIYSYNNEGTIGYKNNNTNIIKNKNGLTD